MSECNASAFTTFRIGPGLVRCICERKPLGPIGVFVAQWQRWEVPLYKL
jgi:hypothetical protein